MKIILKILISLLTVMFIFNFQMVFAMRNDSLNSKRIYFGHQSVGNNIIDGISSLKLDKPIKIVDLQAVGRDIGGNESVIFHSRIGANLDINKKIDDFYNAVVFDLSGNVDIAFMKFCYLDITENTNVIKVFEDYKIRMKKLKNQFPDIVFVHFTVPLTTNPASWKTAVKKIFNIGSVWEYSDNIKRNEYNQILIDEYQGKEPIFDLAAVESTYPSGKRESFEYNGKTYYALVKDYTRDGGHLNDVGSKRVATALIEFLSEL